MTRAAFFTVLVLTRPLKYIQTGQFKDITRNEHAFASLLAEDIETHHFFSLDHAERKVSPCMFGYYQTYVYIRTCPYINTLPVTAGKYLTRVEGCTPLPTDQRTKNCYASLSLFRNLNFGESVLCLASEKSLSFLSTSMYALDTVRYVQGREFRLDTPELTPRLPDLSRVNTGGDLTEQLARHLPHLLSERVLSLGETDKVFASTWLSEDMALLGSKSNQVCPLCM